MADIPCCVPQALGYGGPTDSQLNDLDLGRNSDEDLGVFFLKHLLNVVKPIWRISTWDIFKDMFGISMGYLWDIYVGDV